jgi:hypothetical protein
VVLDEARDVEVALAQVARVLEAHWRTQSPRPSAFKDVSVNVHNDHAACMLCTNNTHPMQTKQPDCTDLSLLSLHAPLIGTPHTQVFVVFFPHVPCARQSTSVSLSRASS